MSSDPARTPSGQRTFSEMSDDPWVTDADRDEALIDEALSLMVAVLIRRGERDLAALLGRSVNVVIEDDHENQGRDLWLEYDPEDAADF